MPWVRSEYPRDRNGLLQCLRGALFHTRQFQRVRLSHDTMRMENVHRVGRTLGICFQEGLALNRAEVLFQRPGQLDTGWETCDPSPQEDLMFEAWDPQ